MTLFFKLLKRVLPVTSLVVGGTICIFAQETEEKDLLKNEVTCLQEVYDEINGCVEMGEEERIKRLKAEEIFLNANQLVYMAVEENQGFELEFDPSDQSVDFTPIKLINIQTTIAGEGQLVGSANIIEGLQTGSIHIRSKNQGKMISYKENKVMFGGNQQLIIQGNIVADYYIPQESKVYTVKVNWESKGSEGELGKKDYLPLRNVVRIESVTLNQKEAIQF